jgi:glycogen(starch) synthase
VKLLLYSHFFAPSIGGVETIVQSLAKGLAGSGARGERKIEVTVVTQTSSGKFDDSSLGFRVVRQPGFLQLLRLIANCDLMHVAGPSLLPMLVGFLLRKPVVVEHHGYQAVCLNGLLIHEPDKSICPGHFQAKRYGECLKCQKVEMSGSQAMIALVKGLIRNFLVRRVARNITITGHVLRRIALPGSLTIYYGIEDRSGARDASQIPRQPAKIIFAYVGRLVWEKGIPILLKAASRLRHEGFDFQIRLIGDGPLRQELQGSIYEQKLENFVSLTGFLVSSALAQALEEVSVVVMPSVWEETAGISALDQMMSGYLVIASDIGGLSEVVGDGGMLFPPGDAEALKNLMREVLENRSLIDSIGSRARKRALELFQRERMVLDHAGLYFEVVDKNGSSIQE